MAPEAETPTPTAVASVIAPVVRASGLFLEDVTIVGPAHRAVVRVTVDLEEKEVGSVELERVAEVSRAVSDALDASDLFPRAYQLEVSSPGTSRPLTEPRHFRRARTRLVRIERTEGQPVVGRVTDVDGGDVVLDVEGDEVRVPLATVRRGRIEVEMKRIDEVDLGPEDEEA